MKKQKFIDIVLVVVIVLSVGFIAIRLLRTSTRTDAVDPSPKMARERIAPLPVAGQQDAGLPQQKIFSLFFHKYLATVPAVSDATWNSIFSNAQVKPYVVENTAACNDATVPDSNALFFVVPKLLEDVKTQSGKIFLDVGAKRCFKKGEQVFVGLYSNAAAQPYMSTAGKTEITGLISLPFDKITPELLTALQMDKTNLGHIVLRPGRKSDYPITIVRFGTFKTVEPPADRPLPAFLRYSVISAQKIKSLKQSGSTIKFIDVRSPQEAKSTLPGVINVPYQVKNHTFKWTTLNGDLLNSDVDESLVLKLNAERARSKTALIVVGDGPTDGRPVWMLRKFLEAETEDVFWYYDGMAALEKAFM